MPELNYKNLPLHYSDSGSGEALLLLHGFLEELSMWNELTAHFEKSHRVVSLDLLGHGATGNLGYIHSMEAQADIIKFLLDRLGIDKCVVIGHSMGGYAGLAFAEHHPEMISGLCLMNSSSRADSDEKKTNRDRAIEAVKKNHRAFVKIAIPNLFSEDNRERFADQIVDITDKALLMSPQGIIAALEGMKVRKERTPLLLEKKFPLLMIIGKKDTALDYDSLLEESEITGADRVIFSDGHMSYIENEHELIRSLAQWGPLVSI